MINSRSPGHRDFIAACPDDRILVESDYNDPACVTGQTWDMVLRVADVKGWSVESEWTDELPRVQWGVVRRLEHNWTLFEAGGHTKTKKQQRRPTRIEGNDHAPG